MTPDLAARAGRRAALLLLLCVRALGAAPPLPAQERPHAPGTLWWIGAGAALGGSLLLDRDIRSTVTEGGGTRWPTLTGQLNHLGNPLYLVPAVGGTYLAGRLTGDHALSSSAIHVLAALLAGGAANGTLKSVVGRERPAGGDADAFHPFSLNNRWQSFPSGHAVVAFSVADAVSEEAGRTWVSAVVYPTAALVGWSRVYADKHWTSDVVGGAIVGVAASRLTLRLLHRRPAPGAAPGPALLLLRPDGMEVRIPVR